MDIIKSEVRLVPNETLANLDISSTDFLNEVDKRDICEICKKSRKYFCYSCYIPMDCIKNKIPVVQLPVLVDIIKFPKEVDGKSTAAHAPILAPHQISIYTYPEIPDYCEKNKVLIIFPGKDSISLEDVANIIQQDFGTENGKGIKELLKVNETVHSSGESFSSEKKSLQNNFLASTSKIQCEDTVSLPSNNKHRQSSISNCACIYPNITCDELARKNCYNEPFRILWSNFPFEKVIFIDSTWNQVQKINNDERLNGIRRVELKNRESLFWRYQRGKPRSYLSTIEAIYYFFVDIHTMFSGRPYKGEYDNLLFFFYFMYKKIHTLYDPKNLRVYSMSKN